jgi:hypothetical protein
MSSRVCKRARGAQWKKKYRVNRSKQRWNGFVHISGARVSFHFLQTREAETGRYGATMGSQSLDMVAEYGGGGAAMEDYREWMITMIVIRGW